MSEPRGDQRSLVEVQIHPGSVRWGVRYLFVTKRHLWGLGLGVGAMLLLVLFGLLIACGLYIIHREARAAARPRG